MRPVTLFAQMKPAIAEIDARGSLLVTSSVSSSVVDKVVDKIADKKVAVRGTSRGFTLIEVMIALTIGLIIIVTVLGVLASTSRGFKVNDDNAKLVDISTLAMRAITNDLSMAGYYGQQNSLAAAVKAYNSLTIDDCGTPPAGYAGALAFNSPVVGLDRFSGGKTSNNSNTAFCGVPAGGSLDVNSPLIQIKYASPPAFDPTPTGGGSGAPKWDSAAYPLNGIYLQADPGGAVVFKGSDYASMKSAGKSRRKPDGTDAPIYTYQTYTYFIASVTPNGGGDQIPTLFRRRLDNTVDPPAFITEPIAEGVERMAVRWGFTNNANLVANVFSYNPQSDTQVPKASGGQTDWSKAISAEVTLLVRIRAPDFRENPNTQFQVEAGNPFSAGAALAFRRKILASTIQFRNRGQ